MEKGDELMIKCNCCGMHWLYLWYDIDENLGNDFSITFVDYGHTFWERLKQAVRHIFNKNDKIYFSEILVEEKDLGRIKDFIGNYLGGVNEREESS